MKIDHIILLESFFLTEYRKRLVGFYRGLQKKMLPEAMSLLKLQVKDLIEVEQIHDLDVDLDSFVEKLLLPHAKSIKNRLKAFSYKPPQDG